MYSEIHNQRARVSSILMDIYAARSDWKRLRHRVKRLYRKGKNTLLSSREDITKLRNKELQEAAVQQELPEITDLLESVEFVLDQFEDIVDIITTKRDEINALNMDLSRQQRVVELLMQTGYPVNNARGKRS